MRESERKRLVELVECATREYTEYSAEMFVMGNYGMESMEDYIADYLLKRGIVVPPVKVGQTVYIVAQISQIIVETKVTGVWTSGDRYNIITDQGVILVNAIGKTVFTSREDAEKALKGDEGK
jgi:hypothetical protein